jgi:hypothetical protein
MVDKATARMLVYGALATLALILVVAVYALATKGSIQSELERRLAELKRKEDDLVKSKEERQRAHKEVEDYEAKLVQEGQRSSALEKEAGEYKKKSHELNKEKESYETQSEILRRKLWDKTDQEKLEQLEQYDDDKLMKELEKEGSDFFSEAEGLDKENLDEKDAHLLGEETKHKKALKGAFDKWQKDGDDGSLEDLEEAGEQNEVLLDELERAARKDSGKKKWADKKRPKRMEQLVHEMELHAEALRVRRDHKKLDKEDHQLEEIEGVAEKDGHDDNDKDFAPKVRSIAEEVQKDEKRLDKEMMQADEREEFDAAKMLEHDAELGKVNLAGLKQRAHDDTKLSAKQKREREKLIEKLDKELVDIESEAQHVEKGLERRNVRKDAVKMAKAANRLDAPNLKHAKRAEENVGQILKDEGAMLQAMKDGNQEDEHKYGVKLADEADDLEEDAEHLFDEVDSGDFDDLDEKLIDEQLAKELEQASQDMEQDAGGVDDDERSRDVREAGGHIQAEAHKFGKEEEQFGASEMVKKDAKKVDEDAHKLAQAVGEQDWEAETRLADQAIADEAALEDDAKNMKMEINGSPSALPDAERKEDEDALKSIQTFGAKLKSEARAVQEDVRERAKAKSERLREKIDQASKIEKGFKQQKPETN